MSNFWEDQMDAASRDSENLIFTIGKEMKKKGVLSKSTSGVTLSHVFMAEKIFSSSPLSCPHLHKNKAPQPMYYYPNANLVSCMRAECIGKLVEASSHSDDKCDFCGKVPSDNQYHEVNFSMGPFTVFGHQCTNCHSTMNVEPPPDVLEKYLRDYTR